jgi:uncharacterized protein
MQYRKVVFAGTMGAGKTTAIRALSEIAPMSTEVANRHTELHGKAQTTVALDYGEIRFGDGEKLCLYGTPGQDRFAFMWPILARGALGVVVLVDHSQVDPISDMTRYLERFAELNRDMPFVIGVGRLDANPAFGLNQYVDSLSQRGWPYPVLAVDVRRKEDALLLIDVLLTMVENTR